VAAAVARPEEGRVARHKDPAKESGARGLYEVLAPAYEMLASPERISREGDAIAAVVLGIGGRSVLDAGCAAGFHAVDLARRGLRVTGIDISPAMIREARARAASASVEVRFAEGDLAEAPGADGNPFDALLCLGNTMASVRSLPERGRVFRAFRRALRPGGVLILQMRDLSAIRREGYAFPTRAFRRGEEEWIFLRRHDPVPGGIRFTSTLLHRITSSAEWETHFSEYIQVPTTAAEWRGALSLAGFTRIRFAADLRGAPRRERRTPDRIVFARA